MKKFWQVFWTSIATFGALVGLYIGAEAEDLEWAFWVVIGGSILVASGVVIRPRVASWSTAIRNYDSLVERAADLQQSVEALERQITRGELAARDQRQKGVTEGICQAYGALKARSTRTPRIVGIAMDAGVPLILASCDEKQYVAGARYDVEVTATGQSKGVVEARAFDTDRGVAALALVVNSNHPFWQGVERKSETDPGPLPGITLRPAALADDWYPRSAEKAIWLNNEEITENE